MSSSKSTKNTKKNFNFKLFWKKSERPSNSAAFLINGKTVVFIACSIISAFINLVFITNLTKSAYTIGTLLSVPAAILLGLMSIGLDLSKCLHSIQVNTLNELYRKLSNRPWASKIKSVSRKWFTVYMLYVILSIITSMSLSTISIGAGITRNANTLKQIDSYITQGEQYTGINKASQNTQTQNLISQATDNTENDAIIATRNAINELWPDVQEWQEEYFEFTEILGLDPNNRDTLEEPYNGSKSYYDYWVKRDKMIRNKLAAAGYQGDTRESTIARLQKSSLEKNIKENYLANYKQTANNAASEKLGELSDNIMAEAMGWLEVLNSVQLVNPKTGEAVVFDTNKTAPDKLPNVLVTTALEKLKALRVDIENDSGDIGSSSKIFMQIGSLFNDSTGNTNTDLNEALNTKSSGSFGSTEIMMMAMLLFLSLLCELAINQFSPKTNISRKMLDQFSQYFDPAFDVNDFMLDVYVEQFNYGSMTKDQFDKAVKETLEMMKVTKKGLLEALDDIADPIPNLRKNSSKIAKKSPKMIKNEVKSAENTLKLENSDEIPTRETKPAEVTALDVSTKEEVPTREIPIREESNKDDKLALLDKVLSEFEMDLGDR